MKKEFKFNHFNVKTDLKKVKEKWVVASMALFSFVSVLNAKNSLNSFLKTVHADISNYHYKRTHSTNQVPTTNLITLSSSKPKISGDYKPITPPMANVKISDYDDQYIDKRRQLSSEAVFNVKKNHSSEVKPIDNKSSNGLLDSLVANIVEQVKTGKNATISASPSSNSRPSSSSSYQSSDRSTFESKSLNNESSESSNSDNDYMKKRADLFEISDSSLRSKINSGQEDNHRRLSVNPNRRKLKRHVVKESNSSRQSVRTGSVKSLNSGLMDDQKSVADTSQSVTSSNEPGFIKSMSSISKSISSRAVEANSLASLNTSLAILKTSSLDSDVQMINSLVKIAASNMAAMDDSINQFNSYSNVSNPVNADDISKNSDISDMLNEIKNRANVGLEPINSLSSFVNTSQSVADGHRNDAMKNINQIRKNTELIQSNANDAITNFANGNNNDGFRFQRSAQSLMNDVNSYSALISQATKAIENNSLPLNDKRSSLNNVIADLGSYASLAQSTVSEALAKSEEENGDAIGFHHTHEVNSLKANSTAASETIVAKPSAAKPTSSHQSFNFHSTSLFNGGSMSLIKSANVNSNESSNVSATSTNQSDNKKVNNDEDKKVENPLINYFRKPKYVYITDSVKVYGNVELSDDELVDSYKPTDLKNAPIFKIVGEGVNKHGDKVYEVVNNRFINAELKLHDLYYGPSSDYHNVEIIKPMGIKAHKKVDFSDVGRRITVGTKLQTNRIINHGNGTRFVLTSGEYITTNKKFIKII